VLVPVLRVVRVVLLRVVGGDRYQQLVVPSRF